MFFIRNWLPALLAGIFLAAPGQAAEPGQVVVVAHRGLLRHAPENTLCNFRSCLELRLGFEFDVQRTRDGQLVCIHDGTVDRTTNGTGSVSDLALAEIRALDAGSWFDSRFAGEKVPTIDEIMALAAEYPQGEVLLAVDLKADHVEQDVVRLALQRGVLDKLLFIGNAISQPQVRRSIRAASPAAHVAAVANNAGEFAAAVADDSADWVYVRFLATAEQVAAARRAGKKVFIAGPTVAGELPDHWRRALTAGIDAILTDYALELSALTRVPAAAE